jgi:hypothetical protein
MPVELRFDRGRIGINHLVGSTEVALWMSVKGLTLVQRAPTYKRWPGYGRALSGSVSEVRFDDFIHSRIELRD